MKLKELAEKATELSREDLRLSAEEFSEAMDLLLTELYSEEFRRSFLRNLSIHISEKIKDNGLKNNE